MDSVEEREIAAGANCKVHPSRSSGTYPEACIKVTRERLAVESDLDI